MWALDDEDFYAGIVNDGAQAEDLVNDLHDELLGYVAGRRPANMQAVQKESARQRRMKVTRLRVAECLAEGKLLTFQAIAERAACSANWATARHGAPPKNALKHYASQRFRL